MVEYPDQVEAVRPSPDGSRNARVSLLEAVAVRIIAPVMLTLAYDGIVGTDAARVLPSWP